MIDKKGGGMAEALSKEYDLHHNMRILAMNKPGLLLRMSAIISRYFLNIEAMEICPVFDRVYSHISLTLTGDFCSISQFVKKCEKLIDVFVVIDGDCAQLDADTLEWALLKIQDEPARINDRASLLDISFSKIIKLEHYSLVWLFGSKDHVEQGMEALKSVHVLACTKNGVAM